jgi:hypothetical protein
MRVPVTERQFSHLRRCCTALVTLLILAALAWKHGHGGVPSHHLLHRADLPGLSCWWDAFVLPLLTWGLLGRLRHRLVFSGTEEAWPPQRDLPVLLGFAAALLFGAVLALLFVGGQEQALSYLVDGLFLLALLFPLYHAECMLGFVLGMTWTFGSVLPTLFASLVALMSVVLYRFIRPWLLRLGRWLLGA